MKIEIKPVQEFHTLFYDDVAAIVFPSKMENNMAVSRCAINFVNGYLEIPEKNINDDELTTAYITDATVLEMDDCLFRVAAHKNFAYLNTLSFDPNNPNSFAMALSKWLDCLDSRYCKCRIFGGDLLTTDMLTCIYKAFSCKPLKQFYMHTSRIDILNDVAKKDIKCPENVFIYARSNVASDIVSMHNFPLVYISNEGSFDLDTYPSGQKKNITIRLGDNNETRLRTKTPWFVFN